MFFPFGGIGGLSAGMLQVQQQGREISQRVPVQDHK
jgi:hypothetical protein